MIAAIDNTSAKPPCTALVRLSVSGPETIADRRRPAAAFVTQLIACRDRIGIYREARREEAAVAVAAYRSVGR